MCTVCVWANNDLPCVSSRNMDWYEDMPTNLWVLPAGREVRGAHPDDPNAVEWTAKYGSIAAVAYGIGSADGLNEKGLAASMLWLAESDYGNRVDSIPALGVALWVQYYLDNFATVKEAVEAFEHHPYQVVPAIVAGRVATVHLQLSDATGDCAVLEIIDGQVVITHGRQFAVLTNSPTFAEQLTNLRSYVGFGGDDPLPGSTEAAARFVRAAYYTRSLPPAENADVAVAQILSVLRNVAQPFGVIDPTRPNISPTRWRTVRNHENIVYFIESSTSPYMVWLNAKNLDFSEGAPAKVLKLDELGQSVGEQSAKLQVEPLFSPAFE